MALPAPTPTPPTETCPSHTPSVPREHTLAPLAGHAHAPGVSHTVEASPPPSLVRYTGDDTELHSSPPCISAAGISHVLEATSSAPDASSIVRVPDRPASPSPYIGDGRDSPDPDAQARAGSPSTASEASSAHTDSESALFRPLSPDIDMWGEASEDDPESEGQNDVVRTNLLWNMATAGLPEGPAANGPPLPAGTTRCQSPVPPTPLDSHVHSGQVGRLQGRTLLFDTRLQHTPDRVSAGTGATPLPQPRGVFATHSGDALHGSLLGRHPHSLGPRPSTRRRHSLGADVYEVEKVLDYKLSGSTLRLLIKWKGYPTSQATWEPETQVDAPQLTRVFFDSITRATADDGQVASAQ